jgi:hypothetical protein
VLRNPRQYNGLLTYDAAVCHSTALLHTVSLIRGSDTQTMEESVGLILAFHFDHQVVGTANRNSEAKLSGDSALYLLPAVPLTLR